MKRIELVFRCNGERTSELALALAQKNIQPSRVHVLDGVRPFSLAVEKMLKLDHDCDAVVYLDADCLLLEDLRPFLEFSTAPSVDGRVRDPFRGRVRAGLHIVRADVVRAMRQLATELGTELSLRPESSLRARALKKLQLKEQPKVINALHDYCQFPHSLFIKGVTRDLRSREPSERASLDQARQSWGPGEEFRAYGAGIEYARGKFPEPPDKSGLAELLKTLPKVAESWTREQRSTALPPLTYEEVDARARESLTDYERFKHKLFCVGLSRTGTHSLTRALDILGYEVAHYPVDPITLNDLRIQRIRYSILEHFDGLSDITAAVNYEKLDFGYRGSKFILTLRNKPNWLGSVRRTWEEKKARPLPDTQDGRTHLEMRKYLRHAVYGTQEFDRQIMSRKYDEHVRAVRSYFRDRPEDLLELDLEGGDGWAELCNFLHRKVPDLPFPHEAANNPKPARRFDLRRVRKLLS